MFMLDDPFLWLLFDFLRQRPRKHLLTTSMSTCMAMTLVEEASLDNLNANVYDYDVGSRGMILHLQNGLFRRPLPTLQVLVNH